MPEQKLNNKWVVILGRLELKGPFRAFNSGIDAFKFAFKYIKYKKKNPFLLASSFCAIFVYKNDRLIWSEKDKWD